MAAQHGDLSEARWRRFTLDQQILSIAAEMHRASNRLALGDLAEVNRGYERVLNLVDLTVAVIRARGLRRELLRWREVVAELFLAPGPSPADHRAALGVLLTFSPEAFKQRPFLVPGLPAST